MSFNDAPPVQRAESHGAWAGHRARTSEPGRREPSSPAAPAADEPAAGAVAEMQGLYGPFSFPEKLLQKMWLRGDFDRQHAQTTDGRRLEVIHGGRWNLLGGPDFRGARLRLDGEPVTGDVEVHLHAGDWGAHGHASDAAYDDVVLHVVLFPPPAGAVTRGAAGREIPVLVLLPLLHHGLEEYAAEEAVESLANRPLSRIAESLGSMAAPELGALMQQLAGARLEQKVRFARLRVQRLGWAEACHHTALEILGYRFNRAAMLRVAGAFPLTAWAEANPQRIFESEPEGWSLQGVRPANHPRTRIGQYADWVKRQPDWPARLREMGAGLPQIDPGATTGEIRHRFAFADVRKRWAEHLCAGAVRGTRLDNLVCDGFLPLLAAGEGREVRGWWHHWFAGDLPVAILRALRQLGVCSERGQPACHGAAQGLLGWLIERERAVATGEGRGA